MRSIALASLVCLSFSFAADVTAQAVLVVDGNSVELQGQQRYDHICVVNGGTLRVAPYAGGSKAASGNLELLAGSVYVDSSSRIDARGAGYQGLLCSDGAGPNDTAGGRGGCSVADSGGGGAHFGGGGRGTVDGDSSGVLYFPEGFEEDCNHEWTGTACDSTAPCGDTLPQCGSGPNTLSCCADVRTARFCRQGPSVAGQAFWHNIYAPDFGAAGGDKGCRDEDGGELAVAGAGGGRVVIAGLRHLGADLNQPASGAAPCGLGLTPGQVRIDGEIDAEGKRGCGYGNDSGGGGAGGTVLIVGQQVTLGSDAFVSVAGGLGGDTNALDPTKGPAADCPAGSQPPGGVCDDCGGGGGGGIISVLSLDSSIDPSAQFFVNGADGGTCTLCKGEAGGGAGELQLDGAYVGEFCDGFDNDFDGEVDEGLGTITCGLGSCQEELPACTAGAPTPCSPDASCLGDVAGARPRIAVVLDTSASMLLDLTGNPTFGDGSDTQAGLDTNGDGLANDSRLYLAKEAVGQVVSAYPEVDFGLARYHQDMAFGRACQTAAWFECQDLIASYDNPVNNGGAPACTRSWDNALGTLTIHSPLADDTQHCINYAGSCGPPRRGADVLAGFGMPARDIVRWLDGRETDFRGTGLTTGNLCDHRSGGDCELRATGPTPLAGSLLAMEDYISPIRALDPAAACRGYTVILVTDGAESCNGNPTAAAARLHDGFGIEVYVIAVSVAPEEVSSLDAIALAGSGGSRSDAIEVNDPAQLVPALTAIVADSLRSEACNDFDDDCDGNIDEDFVGKGDLCGDDEIGVCRSTGTLVCNASENDLECKLSTAGGEAADEICNEEDDDCDGATDEGLDCTDQYCSDLGAEVCNGQDDDCDGRVDETPEGSGQPCGEGLGECMTGETRCISGALQCVGDKVPREEVCNGNDDDCDGEVDNEAPCPGDSICAAGGCRRACNPGQEFPCPLGFLCDEVEPFTGNYCIPSACAKCTTDERCEDNACVDRCAGVVCADNEVCREGDCVDCHTTGCPGEQVCFAGQCQANSCDGVECDESAFCRAGECIKRCSCGAGERCDDAGECEADPCADVICNGGQFCDEGTCRIDQCRNLTCLRGDVCSSSLGCIDNPCPVVECGDAQECAVDARGLPLCVYTVGSEIGSLTSIKERYVSSKGRGLFGCMLGAREPRQGYGQLLPLALALLWFRRKRRSR